jgi:hypothetical protein
MRRINNDTVGDYNVRLKKYRERKDSVTFMFSYKISSLIKQIYLN